MSKLPTGLWQSTQTAVDIRQRWNTELNSVQLKQASGHLSSKIVKLSLYFDNMNNPHCQECQSHREPTSVVPTFLLDFTQFKPML